MFLTIKSNPCLTPCTEIKFRLRVKHLFTKEEKKEKEGKDKEQEEKKKL